MYFVLVNVNSFFDSAKKECASYIWHFAVLNLVSVLTLTIFFNKFGQVDVKLFPNKKKKKAKTLFWSPNVGVMINLVFIFL